MSDKDLARLSELTDRALQASPYSWQPNPESYVPLSRKEERDLAGLAARAVAELKEWRSGTRRLRA